jgi:phosphoribosylformylglycinamidine cyclo-ligase
MFNTFNMGVGMSVVVAKEDADRALAILRENGEDAYLLGEIAEGPDRLVLC